ncbi:NmrA family protein [Coniochaeta sp. 2T2.1]|nr:NmrA family protein [Coniochaeta sp. 2T2.1]
MSTFLVTQATGSQSQWVIKHLLKAGAKVHAVVRNLGKVPELLKDPRITLFKGETQNFDVILQAAQGCKGVFLNTFPIPGLEAQQAKAVVDACLKAGVESIVVSTTYLSNEKTIAGNPLFVNAQLTEYYTSKAAVEDIVRNAGFKSYTILRPAIVQHDYLVPHSYGNFPELPTKGELAHCLNEGAKLPHTDASDIGAFTTAALLDPVRFARKEIDLFNEILGIEETRDIIAEVSGRNVTARRRGPEEEEETLKNVLGQRFQLIANGRDFRDVADIPRKVEKEFGIRLTSLEETLQRERAHLLESIPA